LNTDLRERMGFKGYVLSDWGATHSMAIEQGQDQEMDGFDKNLLYTEEAVALVPNATLDATVKRIMYTWFQTGVFDHAPIQNASDSIGYEKNVTNDDTKAIARELSEQSAILLKNEDKTLPLNFTKTKNILMIGQDDFVNNPITGGAGSGRVDASFIKTPVNELADRLGVDWFVSNDNGPQRHCNNQSCVIYAGQNCHSHSCIPDDWDYDASIVFVGQGTGEGSDRSIEYPDDVK